MKALGRPPWLLISLTVVVLLVVYPPAALWLPRTLGSMAADLVPDWSVQSSRVEGWTVLVQVRVPGDRIAEAGIAVSHFGLQTAVLLLWLGLRGRSRKLSPLELPTFLLALLALLLWQAFLFSAQLSGELARATFTEGSPRLVDWLRGPYLFSGYFPHVGLFLICIGTLVRGRSSRLDIP
jgi:hypothetical protein